MSKERRPDLKVLTADKDTEYALRGLFARTTSLGIRSFSYDIIVHPHKDSGCVRAAEYLRSFENKASYVLVAFDREGCGREHRQSRVEIENDVETDLHAQGWKDRAAVVVLDPEIESWVWSSSPHVAEVLGWRAGEATLREWLVKNSYLREGEVKPMRPKEAMRAALHAVRQPPSASLFEQIASKVSIKGCTDPSFLKLKAVLTRWFASS